MILIIGATGYISGAIQRELRKRNMEFVTVSVRGMQQKVVRELLIYYQRFHEVELVINAAGYVGQPNVDACRQQSNMTECFVANVLLPKMLSELCSGLELPWMHISTGCIFDKPITTAVGEQLFAEDSEPNFTFSNKRHSFYTGCKALAETHLKDSNNVYNWRIRMPFCGTNDTRCYLAKLLKYPQTIRSVESLTYLPAFAKEILDAWAKRIPPGTYHATSRGYISTPTVMKLLSKHCSLRTSTIQYIDRSELEATLAEPRSSCVLDTGKLESALKRTRSHVHSLVEQTTRQSSILRKLATARNQAADTQTLYFRK